MEIIVGKDTDNNVMQAGFAKSENRELGYLLSTDIPSQSNIIYDYYSDTYLTTGNNIYVFAPVSADYVYSLRMITFRISSGAVDYIRWHYYDLSHYILFHNTASLSMTIPYTYTYNFVLKTGMFLRVLTKVSTQPCTLIASVHYIKIPMS